VPGGENFTPRPRTCRTPSRRWAAPPQEHRTDSLSAAYRNLDREAAEDATRRYDAFCAHYGMAASRNNFGEAHENGAVEAHIFPRSEYPAWAALAGALPRRAACRHMVDLLWLAHDQACETELATELAAGHLPDAATLKLRLAPPQRDLPEDVPVALTALGQFDALLEAPAYLPEQAAPVAAGLSRR
jgi:hypothetical protein